ncbi:hypothetical protein BOX15_Mlig006326g2 [Macrostomum lignano]|uniref:Uncharacterized protein n=1 Tax=Macrostomum lignano TaxID=282301 RepID=A0A267GH33_9PLAT|nr:hypothetical protein BOX15_Mlig006326g2 [Macrostomum lignano]
MAAASSADSEGTGNSSNAANYLLEMLKQFRLANPRSTSEEFILHIRDQLGRVNFANCYTAEGWRQLMRLESTVLLDFFASVHPDFRDYQLDMLLEQLTGWFRLESEYFVSVC